MTKKDLFFLKLLEICWLIISASSLFTSVYDWKYNGFSRNCIMYFVVSMLSLGMFLFRRHTRKQKMQN
jgi:hypothetical protein